MPLLSIWTPTGTLRLASEPSYGESLYHALIASLGGNYSVEPGSRMEATVYAMAMGLAESRHLLEHAGRQMAPEQVDEMMADREREYGLVPGQYDTLAERLAALAARMLLPRGNRREAVVDALQTLLGDDFVGYRTTLASEIINWPTALGGQPMNLQLPLTPRNLLRITSAISIGLGSPQSVAFTMVDPTTVELFAGQNLVVEPENPGNAEVVEIEAITVAGDPQTKQSPLTATFNNAHPPGCLATTASWPMWNGTQREVVVVVSPAAAADAETRRKLNELMARMMRGVTTWSIVAESAPAGSLTAGPFILEASPLNATPFVTVSL